MLGLPKALLSLFFGLLIKPEFRKLVTTLDYLQLASYNDKDDLVIILGHKGKPSEESEETQENASLGFLLTVHKTAPEGIIQPFEGGTTLTFILDKEAKQKAKEMFK